jgi:hypothetical protein
MRRLQLGVLTLGVCAFLGVMLAGCSKSTDEGTTGGGTTEGKKGGDQTATTKTKGELKPVAATGTGTLKGMVILKGPKPDLSRETADLKAQMEKKDKAHCIDGAPADQVVDQTLRVGANNGVGYAVVWLRPPDGQFFKVEKDKLGDSVPMTVALDQPHCAFVPHVLALFPSFPDPSKPSSQVRSGQKFIVKNSAGTSHNTLLKGDVKNPEVNKTLEPKSEMEVKLNPSREPVTIRCNIHTWMTGYAWVFDHPYAAVTKESDKDDDPAFGTYEIKNVPLGVKGMRVVVWHERTNFVPDQKGVEIDLSQPETTKDFELTMPEKK